MSNGNDPAMPASADDVERGNYIGLTKLEHFAAMAMQGLCANNAYSSYTPGDLSDIAVRHAYALLKELEQS